MVNAAGGSWNGAPHLRYTATSCRTSTSCRTATQTRADTRHRATHRDPPLRAGGTGLELQVALIVATYSRHNQLSHFSHTRKMGARGVSPPGYGEERQYYGEERQHYGESFGRRAPDKVLTGQVTKPRVKKAPAERRLKRLASDTIRPSSILKTSCMAGRQPNSALTNMMAVFGKGHRTDLAKSTREPPANGPPDTRHPHEHVTWTADRLTGAP